jgi:molybdopterin synthase sulfur carrier subunit
MAQVWIPALLRDLTGGQEKVTVNGATIEAVIDALEERYPGIRSRLCEGDSLRPNLVMVVDGSMRTRKLRRRVAPSSEIAFVPAISGG